MKMERKKSGTSAIQRDSRGGGGGGVVVMAAMLYIYIEKAKEQCSNSSVRNDCTSTRRHMHRTLAHNLK